jgi:SAM-dependent methyltransferase
MRGNEAARPAFRRRIRMLGGSLESLAGSVAYRAEVVAGGRHRFNCGTQDRVAWDERADAAVALLASSRPSLDTGGELRIADLGCGNQRLRRHLERRLGRSFEYAGYDLLPQSDDVRRLDVERALPDGRFDVVFCLGLLEYLRDVSSFARRLRGGCRAAVTSYVTAGTPGGLSRGQRRRHGWRSHHTESDLTGIFLSSGFERRAFTTVHDGATGIWLWSAGD